MHFPRAALGLAIAIAPLGVLSQIVTITERPSACSAIYTTGSSSVTVVQSTVTVAPIPFTDALVNGGTPFVIQVQPGTAARRRQAESSTYINANGRTTTNASEAATYRILNGTLQGGDGGYISTDANSDSVSFALDAVKKAISTTFFSRDLEIGWNSTAFADGACDFYTTAAGDGSLDVISYFRGVIDASWLAVTFAVRAIESLDLEPETSSTTVSTVISMGGGVTATPAVSTSTAGALVPTASGEPTGNGYCGASAGVCDGVVFGSCCSQYGACGNTDEYCGVGCQSAFGICNPVVASSSVAAGVSSAAPTAPIYSATVPQPASSTPVVSSIAPVYSTSVYQFTSRFLSTSGSLTLTMTTMVSVTTSLPVYTAPGTPIGPINPPAYSSSTVASSSAVAVSSPGLPASYPVTASSVASTFVGISSVPVVSIPTSAAVSVSVPVVPSVVSSSVRTTSIATGGGPATGPVAPSYSSPNAVSSIPLPSIYSSRSSVSIPLPSFYSSPAASVTPRTSSVVAPIITSTSTGTTSTIYVTPVPSSAPSSCPGAVDGTISTDSSGEPYTLYCNSDYSDNLTQFPDIPSFDACLLACDKTAGCNAAAWIPTSKYCYLKPAGGYVTGTGGYVGVRVRGAVPHNSSSLAAISTAPIPDTYPTTSSVPVLPTEQSYPAISTPTPIIASSSSLPPAPIYSSTPIPDTYPTTTSIAPEFSSTPLPEVFSSTPIPDTYPTTTASTPTSSSYLVLPSPILCDFGDPIGYGEDDSYCQITLPQPMVLYSKSSVNTYASTNGFLSILSGATQYQNAETLPTDQVTEADNTTPLSALFPFWDDLAIPEGDSPYGIWYQLTATGVTYEFYLTRPTETIVFHFTVGYTYANPGVATFTYYALDDPGTLATVGSQGFDATGTAVASLYSYQSGTIYEGLVLVCDTLANTCVKGPTSA